MAIVSKALSLKTIYNNLQKPFTGSLNDILVAASTCALVGFSIYLPLDAFINQSDYAPPVLTFSNDNAASNEVIAIRQGTSYERDLLNGELLFVDGEIKTRADSIATGNVARTTGEQLAGEFKMLHVGHKSALIEGRDGFLTVSKGSRLPDGSRVLFMFNDINGTGMTTTRQTYLLE